MNEQFDDLYIEAPNHIPSGETPNNTNFPSVFLAGGITGCPDWQSEIRYLLKDIIMFNPRRADFPIGDPNAALEQIKWEHDYLRVANSILFWFPCETLCPIVLYELGAWSITNKQIFVGVHPNYQRKQDVEIQTKLARPSVSITYSIQGLTHAVNKWAKYGYGFQNQ